MKADQAMKPIIFALIALFWSSCAFGANGPEGADPIAAVSSFVQVKLTSSMSAASSKVGDPVTAVAMGPDHRLLGATMEGTVDRAEKDVVAFSFHTLKLNGNSYPIQSQVISVVNSKGIAGQDDLGQRVRVEGDNVIAYGITTALNDGSEIRLSVWKK